jgi:2-(1,2-epoxy-1,2-dihydrophenyl)acetyl-CoA isomerase
MQEPADMSDAVLTAQTGAVRVITLNRPQALNSFTLPMHAALRQALKDAEDDETVRAVVLTGAGRAFCAGQDLAEITAPGTPGVGDLVAEHYKPLALQVRRLRVPVVAAVNGVAAGAGANLALGTDLVVAAQSASFIQAFAKIGLVPDCGGTWLLPRLLGRAQALGLAMTADKLSAEQAHRMGLIWQCVPDAELMGSAMALAERLAALPTRALVATRLAMDAAQHLDLDAALTEEGRWQGELSAAHDYQEGVAAFIAKRLPVFKDR